MVIYKLTSPSGKSYVGKTSKSIEKRLKTHISLWKTDITYNRKRK